MKKLRSLFIALTLSALGVVLGLSPLIVSATTTETVDSQNPVISISNPPSKDKQGLEALCTSVNTAIHDKGIWKSTEGKSSIFGSKSKEYYTNLDSDSVKAKNFLSYSYSDDVVSIHVNMIEYKKLSQKNKQVVMQQALSTIYNADGVSRTNKNKLYNDIAALDSTTSSLVRQLSEDVTADYNTAYGYLKKYAKPLSVILGVLVLALFSILTLTLVFDIAYITLPMAQAFFNWCADRKKDKNGGRPMFVSIEAIDAVKQAESKAGQEYVNPVGIYFASKTKQLIAVALCLTYLVSGNIYNLIGSIIDYLNMALNL